MKYQKFSGRVIQLDTEKKEVAVGADEFVYVEAVEKDLVKAMETDSEIVVLAEGIEKPNKITNVFQIH
jgi:hypothetical protein